MMSRNPAVDVIVVNWNAGAQLAACIDSIKKFGAPYVAQTIVVDNGSTDGSALAIAQNTGITLLLTGENLGFGKACNLAAREAHSDYLLFLNPDAALYSNTLPKMLAFMQDEVNSMVGICGAQLLDASGMIVRSCARFPSVVSFLTQSVGLDRFLRQTGHVMSEWNHSETRDVNHVIGACYLVRRSLFNALTGFDERFFLYLEDIDFSYRAISANWRITYLATAQAFHVGGGTSSQVKAKRLFYSLRSRLIYADKHFSRFGSILVALSTLLLEPISRGLLAVSRISWLNLKELWLAYSLLWHWLPQWLLKGLAK